MERCFHAIQSVTLQAIEVGHENGPGNEANEVMKQLNQTAPDAHSVLTVTMEVACQ